jgi:hypothetical protein
MKELLKKTAALWIAVIVALSGLCLTTGLRVDAADAGSAYLTVELLPFTGLQKNNKLQPLGEGFLCGPAKIAIVSGETAAQTLMRYLSARGYTAFFKGSATKGYKLGYIADGDKTAAYQGYASSAKDYPVKSAKKIELTGELPSLAQAMLGSYNVNWDPEKDKINIKGYLGEKDLTDEAGWVFSLNNEYLTKSLSDVKLANGDTLRVQFTLAGGRELGYTFPQNGGVKTTSANRTKLIKLVADYANNHAGSSLYNDAYAALGSLSMTQEDVTRLYGGLVNELKELKLYTDATKPASTTSTTATTKPASTTSTTTTTKPASTSSTTTTKPASTTSTTTTTKPASTTSTTAATTTTKPASTTSTTAAPQSSSTSTTKSSSTATTASSGSVTARPYTPLTTAAGGSGSLLTTVIGQTTLPGETTTIERPEGIVLEHMNKTVPTTEEEETTAPEEEEETTEAPQTFVEKLKALRYSDGMVRNIIIVCAVIVLVVVVAIVIRKRSKKVL